MSRAVYLHVGAPKTGTTYLQDRLARNAASLARHGVHFPSRSRLVDADLFHFQAALDLLGQDWGGPPGHADGAWETMLRRVRRTSGTVVISHEILAPAPPETVCRVMRELGEGGGTEVHVVYTARDLARQLPAAWQESIKQGRKWSYARFLRRAQRGKPWFARAFDLPQVLGTWGTQLPPERVHVVTVPHRGPDTPPDLLWHRFCEAIGADPAWAPLDTDRANRSLGIAETQVVRRLNQRVGRTARREADYDHLVLEHLAQGHLADRGSPAVRLPPRDFDWVEERTERWVEWLQGSGVHVVGDLDDLRPRRPAPDTRWHDPDKVPAKLLAAAALDALEGMTREAARRPDPDRALGARLRHQAARLRDR